MKEELEKSLQDIHNDLATKQKKIEVLEKENQNLREHLDNIDQELIKHGKAYEEDYLKRKDDVDEYRKKMESHITEIDSEISKLDEYREKNTE